MKIFNFYRHPIRWLATGLVIAAMAGNAFASDDRELALSLQKAGKILSLEAIYAKARSIKPGKILDTEFEAKKNLYQYEIELLDASGRVWEMKLNAATGELIKLERED